MGFAYAADEKRRTEQRVHDTSYTTAALWTENKTLCFPASADSIPTSLGQEDHVSMGSISGRKLYRVLDNLEYILAIELLSACQAIEFRRPLRSSEILESAHDYVRQFVSFPKKTGYLQMISIRSRPSSMTILL